MVKLTCASRTKEEGVSCPGARTFCTVSGSIIHMRGASCESGWNKTGTVPNCGTACCEPRSRDRAGQCEDDGGRVHTPVRMKALQKNQGRTDQMLGAMADVLTSVALPTQQWVSCVFISPSVGRLCLLFCFYFPDTLHQNPWVTKCRRGCVRPVVSFISRRV